MSEHKRWLGLALGIQLVVAAACWAVLSRWTARTNHAIQGVEALSPETEVLVLGTSHVDCGVDPRRFTSRLNNLSGVALNYATMVGVLAAHIDSLSGLQTVVIELDSFPLRYDTLRVLKDDYSRLLDLRPEISAMRVPAVSKWELAQHHLLRYSATLAPFFASYKIIPQNLGERLAIGLGNPRVEVNGEGSAEIHPGFREFSTNMIAQDGAYKLAIHERETRSVPAVTLETNEAALQEMVELLRARGLAVVLLRLPHRRGYWEQRPEAWDRQFQQAASTATAKTGASLWDLERLAGLTPGDWYDGDHLNGSGARKFSHALNGLLETLKASGIQSAERKAATLVAH